MKKIRIGCSSFNNINWKKVFYPEDIPKVKWFQYYCTHFDTYEMNGTFYKFPTVKTMQNWYHKAPEDFLFSVKAPKEITHTRKFINCEGVIENFYDICKTGLKEKLGCILFQFPPSYQYSKEKLQEIIKQLNPEFNNVIEFRHKSWWIPEVWNELSNNNITFCSVSHPTLPNTVFMEFSNIYIRLHGISNMFYSSYTDEELEDLNKTISSDDEKKPVFIYFNNTASTAGILNALTIKKISERIEAITS